MRDKSDVMDARILIVDDRGANVLLLEQLLQAVGYRHVMSTQDPFAVCDLHRANNFDLILLDLQMPGMDGFAVMAGLAQIETQAKGYVPVLAITVQPGHKLRALAAGAKDFIAKPFELEELKTRIHNLLEVRLLHKKLSNAVNTLETMALHDALTGLANRRLLMDRLNQSRLSSARTHNHCALMFMDVDKFKQLNDTLGHDVGDQLLQQVSARLLLCVREGDCVARFGGDEFVVLLDALSQNAAGAAQQAHSVARKILQMMQQPFDLQGHSVAASLSVGSVIFLGAQEPADEVLRQADLAMYRAKAMGRGRLCAFDAALPADLVVNTPQDTVR